MSGMADEQEEGEELQAILQAVEQYNLKATTQDRLTRLTLLLAMGNEGPIALLAGPPVKTPPLNPRQLN